MPPPKSQPSKKLKKDQKLSMESKELDEDIDIFLTTKNPYMSEKCVEFEYKTQTFKPVSDYKKPVIFYRKRGSIKRRLVGMYGVVYEEIDVIKEDEKMKNKFNFRSVGLQTDTFQYTDQNDGIDAAMFSVLKFNDVASKSVITAAYQEYENKLKFIEKENWMRGDLTTLLKQVGLKNINLRNENSHNLRLCERMLDQNMSIANLDFTYYDNPNDEFRPNFGSLLPLWTLPNRTSRSMQVTCISWNLHYPDLFAVGFREFGEETEDLDDVEDLTKNRETGWVSVYSLKGPSHPERMAEFPTGVCNIQFHPKLSHLLAVALTGGCLVIYDIKRKDIPNLVKDSKFEKQFHKDDISEIRWLPDIFPQKLCTVSFDGQIINWNFLMDNIFLKEIVFSLKVKEWPIEAPPKGLEMSIEPKQEPDDILEVQTSGTTISVNNCDSELFLVGTISGLIHKYRFDEKIRSNTYEGHWNSIKSVFWNPFHPTVFLSCSKDMTVQVWKETHNQSLFEFFFESNVKGVAWAPFSSTLFAAISGNSMVSVFDLALNKIDAVGTYAVYTPKQNIELTSVQFHPTKPILIVGDERGCVIIFKLSPNLRSSLNSMNTLEWSEFVDGEKEKLEKLLKYNVYSIS